MAQPMGLGVGPSRFERNDEAEKLKASIAEQAAIQQAARLEEELKNSPMLSAFIAEMESTMLRIYLEHPDGQAQARLLKRLQIGVDPTAVIKNLVRRRMGAALSAIAEP